MNRLIELAQDPAKAAELAEAQARAELAIAVLDGLLFRARIARHADEAQQSLRARLGATS